MFRAGVVWVENHHCFRPKPLIKPGSWISAAPPSISQIGLSFWRRVPSAGYVRLKLARATSVFLKGLSDSMIDGLYSNPPFWPCHSSEELPYPAPWPLCEYLQFTDIL